MTAEPEKHMEIIDSRGDLLDYSEASTALEAVQSILPYFPDDERMANYLCYVASGWTRDQSLKRALATPEDRVLWREIEEFRLLDDAGYDALRRDVANAYLERKIRRNTIQWIEFDFALLETAQEKWRNNIDLTKDEKAILLSRSKNYSPEALAMINKLTTPRPLLGEGFEADGGVVDIMAIVMRRQQRLA